MIHNIIFDMGQVLITWSPALLTEPLGLDAADRQLLILETFQNTEWIKLDRGTISLDEGIQSICARLPERLHPCVRQLVCGWWEPGLHPTPGMAQLLEELKSQGYGLYLLSNAATTLRTYLPQLPGADLFDGVYISAEHRLLKPQPEIYTSFLRTFSLAPETCFFVDDSPANIEAAEGCGICGTVFHGDTPRLRREMQAHGIFKLSEN